MILNNINPKNKTILITGSSRAIGLNIAISLIKEGHNIIINGRNKKKLINIKKNTLKLIIFVLIYLKFQVLKLHQKQ